MATDPNGDTLTYTLGGTDAASFNIDRGERPANDQGQAGLRGQEHYMVTVTAADPTASATPST